MIEIKNIDPTVIQLMNDETVELAMKLTEYQCEFWQQTGRGKVRKTYNKNFVSGSRRLGWFLYAGFKNRVKEYCEIKCIEFREMGEELRLEPVREPYLKGIEPRPIQLEAIKAIHKHQRGIISMATGSGKTLTIALLLSTYKNPKCLFICRSLDLALQAHQVFTSHGFKSCLIGGGAKEITAPIVCGTIQTYLSLHNIHRSSYFDIICYDECHNGSSVGGQMEKLLPTLLCPVRIGLSATPPTEPANFLLLNGLFGDTLLNASTSYGIEEGFLSTPKIVLLPVPENKSLRDVKTYVMMRKLGIVENPIRNAIIAKTVKKEIEEGRSCLVFCIELDHITKLSKLFNEMGILHNSAFGEVSSEDREIIKNDLDSKKNLVVISSNVFCAGIDVKSLDSIILGCGGKSEENLIQRIGRALRVTDEKNTATIFDLLDSSKFLSGHTVSRLAVYVKNGWL